MIKKEKGVVSDKGSAQKAKVKKAAVILDSDKVVKDLDVTVEGQLNGSDSHGYLEEGSEEMKVVLDEMIKDSEDKALKNPNKELLGSNSWKLITYIHRPLDNDYRHITRGFEYPKGVLIQVTEKYGASISTAIIEMSGRRLVKDIDETYKIQ